jgi:hypothetical protein
MVAVLHLPIRPSRAMSCPSWRAQLVFRRGIAPDRAHRSPLCAENGKYQLVTFEGRRAVVGDIARVVASAVFGALMLPISHW